MLYMRKLRSRYYKAKFNDSMPANLWFYSQLVNIEAGVHKATYKNLFDTFIKFLFRKYKIQKKELKKKTYFELVREREDNDDVIDLYGEIWNSIDEMKHASSNEVLSYIKKIKLIFNKGNFEDWIKTQKRKAPCNNC